MTNVNAEVKLLTPVNAPIGMAFVKNCWSSKSIRPLGEHTFVQTVFSWCVLFLSLCDGCRRCTRVISIQKWWNWNAIISFWKHVEAHTFTSISFIIPILTHHLLSFSIGMNDSHLALKFELWTNFFFRNEHTNALNRFSMGNSNSNFCYDIYIYFPMRLVWLI